MFKLIIKMEMSETFVEKRKKETKTEMEGR